MYTWTETEAFYSQVTSSSRYYEFAQRQLELVAVLKLHMYFRKLEVFASPLSLNLKIPDTKWIVIIDWWEQDNTYVIYSTRVGSTEYTWENRITADIDGMIPTLLDFIENRLGEDLQPE